MSDLEFELVRDFIPVLVTGYFEDDSIKSGGAILRTIYIVYGKIFRRSRANNSKVNGPIWPEIELIRYFIDVLVTCKFEEDPIKTEVAIDRIIFSPL